MVQQEIQVTKRDGTREPLDINKIHKVVAFACEGITGVSVSEIELRSNLQFHHGIKTNDIQETLIKAAADLISEETPNYQYVAANLINYHLRKQVYNSVTPPRLYDHVKRIMDLGYYDTQLFSSYTEAEWDVLNTYVDHDRDFTFTFAGMEQLRGKYLVKNRSTGDIYETPQVAYILIAAVLFGRYTKNRLKWVKDFYDAISTFQLSLPTPIMAGVRTPQRQFSSCVLIETADSLDSISATASAVVKYVSQKAGIGLGAGAIRAINSVIRNGDAVHTGVLPFYKFLAAAVKSCSQGGIRSGAATLHWPIWHLEAEENLVLKNNKGTEETRLRGIDYSVQFNKLMYERLLTGGNITLFSPSDVEGLYDAFFSDQDEFKRLYEAAEKNPKIRKKVIPAVELFSAYMTERKNTGRLYLMNVDHCNDHGSFLDAIRMSNLCQEVTQPTTPLKHLYDLEGEISLCTLMAVNAGVIRQLKDLEKIANLAVRALDELIDYQDYPVPCAELWGKRRRNLGVGIINWAFWMAKNDISYQNVDKEGLRKIHEFAEAWSYYLIKASVDLAKEKGHCEWSHRTKYHHGILPIDTYKKEVDELAEPSYNMNWDALRAELREHGIRNSTLMCLMPSEASSLVSNSTNGIEPPRAFVSAKVSKEGVMKQVVPGFKRLKNKYDLLWDQKSPEGYLKIVAVLQKFIDQSISTNTTYNPKFYPDNELPMSEMLKHLVMAYKYGIKTLYYFNTEDGAGEENVQLPAGEETEADCDSCKI